MNDLTIFESPEFGSIRTVEEDGKVLFCGNDVAKALGYKRPADAITTHCKGSVIRRLPTAGGEQSMKFIPRGMFTGWLPRASCRGRSGLKAGSLTR